MTTTMHRPCPALFALFSAVWLTACGITPAQRIQQAPDIYAQLSPEQQKQVSAGEVAVGFDAAATRLALGEPDRIVERVSAEGVTVVWQYFDVIAAAPPIGPHYCTYFRSAVPGSCLYPLAVQQLSERVRVHLRDGKVVSIERER